MKRRLFSIMGVCLLVLLMSGYSFAYISLNLYESQDGINPASATNPATERPPAILLPEDVVDGMVRVWEMDPVLQTQYPYLEYPYDWMSDFVWFYEASTGTGAMGQFVQLFSDPFTEEEVDRFMAITPYANILETAPPTTYTAGYNQYYIWSDAPELIPTPEPGTLLMLGFGLAGLVGLRRKLNS